MAKLMIFILVVTSLALAHAELESRSLASDSHFNTQEAAQKQQRLQQQQHHRDVLAALAGGPDAASSSSSIDDSPFDKGQREYDDNIDFAKLNEGLRYDVLVPTNEAADADGGPTAAQRGGGGGGKNLARLLHGMPAFNRFAARYQPEKRAAIKQRLELDKDDREFAAGQMGSLAARLSRADTSLERLVQRLRDRIVLANSNRAAFRGAPAPTDADGYRPEVYDSERGILLIENNNNGAGKAPFMENRDKRRRCQIDPNLGIKNPSLCDTDSYFGAADYTMRNVWDSAGRR